MAEKPRKKPVRKAPQRKDFTSEVAWLEAKIEYARQHQRQENVTKVERLNKRIASVQKQRAELDAKLNKLEDERSTLIAEGVESEIPTEA